jgi:hypothetical protein
VCWLNGSQPSSITDYLHWLLTKKLIALVLVRATKAKVETLASIIGSSVQHTVLSDFWPWVLVIFDHGVG